MFVYLVFFCLLRLCAAVVCLTGEGQPRNPMAAAGCPFRMVSEQHLAAGAVAAHYIHACGLAHGGVGAAIHLASLHVVEGQVQLLRVVQHAALHAYALRHNCRWQAGGVYGLQVEFIPNGCCQIAGEC